MSLLRIYVKFDKNIKFKTFLKVKFKSQISSSCFEVMVFFSQII